MKKTFVPVILAIFFFLSGCATPAKQTAPEYTASGQTEQSGEKPLRFSTRAVLSDKQQYGRVFQKELDATNFNADILFFGEKLLLAETNDIWEIDPHTGEKKGSMVHTNETIASVGADAARLFVGTQNTLFTSSGNSDIIQYDQNGIKKRRFKMASGANPDVMVPVGNTLYVLTHADLVECYDITTGELLVTKKLKLPHTMDITGLQANEQGIVLQAQSSRYDNVLLLYSPDRLDKHLVTIPYVRGFALTDDGLFYVDSQLHTLNRYDLADKQTNRIKSDQFRMLFADRGFIVGVRSAKEFDLLDHKGNVLLKQAAFPLYEKNLKTTRVQNGRFALLSAGIIEHKIELWDFSTFIKQDHPIPSGIAIDPAYPFESVKKLYEALPDNEGGSDRLQSAFDAVLGDAYVSDLAYTDKTNELNITLASTKSEYETTFAVQGIDLALSKVMSGLKEKLDIRAFFRRDITQPKLENIVVVFEGKTYPTLISDQPFVSKTVRMAREEARKKEALYAAQACRLKHDNWYYLGNACRDGLAHGEGKAILLTDDNITFEGTIQEGLFVTGTLSAADTRLWVGPFAEGKPEGKGVCFNDGEPESCEFFEGKQIDALYIQRQEMEALRQQIAELEAKQRLLEGRLSNKSQRKESAGSSSLGEKVGEAVAREIGKALLQKLFQSR